MEQTAKNLANVKASLPDHVCLVAVSKTYSPVQIMPAYHAGQRDFGENKVQELTEKAAQMPNDIRWHLIGHLQRNKVKYIAPFVHLIHSVDSFKLLQEIDKRAAQNNRSIPCLLQIHIAEEDTKFGLSFDECEAMIADENFAQLNHVVVRGLMGMATFTDNVAQVKREFQSLKSFFDKLREKFNPRPNWQPETLSMGMSGDYQTALACGSNMVRVGSAIFGERHYH